MALSYKHYVELMRGSPYSFTWLIKGVSFYFMCILNYVFPCSLGTKKKKENLFSRLAVCDLFIALALWQPTSGFS